MSRRKAASFNFFDLPIIIDADHPFSQGKTLRVATTYPDAAKTIRIDRAVMKLARAGEVWQAKVSFIHPDQRAKVMLIDLPNRDVARLAELVSHETSHLTDEFFAQCNIQYLHTEVRAYYLDWMVGKIFRHFNI
jgi:hypothetical protein